MHRPQRGGVRGHAARYTLTAVTAEADATLITAVTLAELSVGPLVATEERERVARQTRLQQAEADFKSLLFDADAARAFVSVASSLRRTGRKATVRT